MPLVDHLRELRARIIKSLIAIAVGMGVGFAVYEQVWDFLRAPYCAIGDCTLIITGVFDGFLVQLKVAALVGILVGCPVWLYQMWAFVTPAMRGREKAYTYGFIGAAVPLFLAGAGVAYYIASLALRVMFAFLPEDVEEFITIGNYLNYMILIMLAFGLAFVLPLLVVALNFVGVLPHSTIARWRRVIVFAVFAISAIVTPADPISMVVLGGCLLALFETAELIAYLNDRRKRRADPYADLSDDEVSSLEDIDPVDGPADDAADPSATR